MFNKIKNLLLIIAVIFGLPMVGVQANDCDLDELLKVLKGDLTGRYKNVLENKTATKHAKRVKNLGLSDSSYMVKWQLKRENQTGPWAMKGNTLVNGIKRSNGRKWMDEIGMKSFGLGFEELPGDVEDTPSAVLRWKNHYLYFGAIQGDSVADISRHFDPSNRWTEATFMATEEELQLIKAFFEARVNGEILAKKAVRSRGSIIEVGQRIDPQFDFTGSNLFEESCASACTSVFNPRWLEHYDAPKALQLASIALDKGIRPEVNAKALVYYNFRNTQSSGITVLGLPNEITGAKFMEENEWSQIGGMMWGFIPDRMPSKPSPNYTNKRFLIPQWLAENE